MIVLNFSNKPSTKATFAHPIQIKLQKGPCIKSYLHNYPYIFKIRPLLTQFKHMMHKINTFLLCRHLGCHIYVHPILTRFVCWVKPTQGQPPIFLYLREKLGWFNPSQVQPPIITRFIRIFQKKADSKRDNNETTQRFFKSCSNN